MHFEHIEDKTLKKNTPQNKWIKNHAQKTPVHKETNIMEPKKQTGNEHKINKQETNNSTQIKVNKVYQKLN